MKVHNALYYITIHIQEYADLLSKDSFNNKNDVKMYLKFCTVKLYIIF